MQEQLEQLQGEREQLQRTTPHSSMHCNAQ